MSTTQNPPATGNISAAILISIILTALKLCGAITWSWWIIIAPIWVFPAISMTILLFQALFSLASIPFIKARNK